MVKRHHVYSNKSGMALPVRGFGTGFASYYYTMHAEIVTAALNAAFQVRKPAPGLIFHSDRGVQYASQEVVRLLQSRQVKQSMSKKRDCYDNAITETVFATLKKELVYRCKFANRETAKSEIFKYLEVFYNRDHSALGYLTPEEFERRSA